MKIKLKKIEDVQRFILNSNESLGYPDGKGTDTYCNVPYITEVKDSAGNVVESYYEIPVTGELYEYMAKLAIEKMLE